MRKLLILISAIIGIVILAIIFIPFYFGLCLQKQYPQLLENLEKTSNVQLQLVEFKRGWFSSTAQVKVILPDQILLQKEPITQFVIQQTIDHGLLIFTKDLSDRNKFYFTRALIKNRVQINQFQMRAMSVWTLDNRLKSTVLIPEIQLSYQQEQQLTAQNIRANIEYVLNSTEVRGDVKGDELHLSMLKPKQEMSAIESSMITPQVQLDHVQLAFDNKQQANGLWYGMSELIIPTIKLLPDQTNPTLLHGFKLTMHQDLTAPEKTGLKVFLHIDAIKNSKIDFKQFDVALSLSDLKNSALIKISDGLEQNQLVYSDIFNLLAGGMTIELNPLSFTTTDGVVKLQAQLHLPSQGINTKNPFFWLQTYRKLFVNMQLQLPMATLKQWLSNFYQEKTREMNDATPINKSAAIDKQINYWFDNNILKKQDEYVLTKVKLEKGRLFVNDAPLKTEHLFLDTETLLQEQEPQPKPVFKLPFQNGSQDKPVNNSLNSLKEKESNINVVPKIQGENMLSNPKPH